MPLAFHPAVNLLEEICMIWVVSLSNRCRELPALSHPEIFRTQQADHPEPVSNGAILDFFHFVESSPY
jgi:hypothetical protein